MAIEAQQGGRDAGMRQAALAEAKRKVFQARAKREALLKPAKEEWRAWMTQEEAEAMRDRAQRQQRAQDLRDGMLADRMRLLPEGRFCAFGGLNPHVAGLHEEGATCRSCERNDECLQPWKAPLY